MRLSSEELAVLKSRLNAVKLSVEKNMLVYTRIANGVLAKVDEEISTCRQSNVFAEKQEKKVNAWETESQATSDEMYQNELESIGLRTRQRRTLTAIAGVLDGSGATVPCGQTGVGSPSGRLGPPV